MLDECRLGLIEFQPDGAELEDGHIVDVASLGEFVETVPQVEDRLLGDHDAMLLQGDLVDGVLDFSGRLGFGVFVEHRQLVTPHGDFVLVAPETPQGVDHSAAGFDRADGRVGIVQHGPGDGERDFLQVAQHDGQSPQIGATFQPDGAEVGCQRIQIWIPVHLGPEEAVFVERAVHELLQLAVELQPEGIPVS